VNSLSFSVVVPTCRRNDLLARCLERLAPGAQTLDAGRYEVIVTDDGRDATAEAMIREQFPWAKWTAGPARGPAANRNHGASQAQFEWIAFTDDDCLPSPGWLEAFAKAIDGEHTVYEGRTTCEDGLPSPAYAAPLNENGGFLWTCNMIISAETFERVGGLCEHFPYPAVEDVEFRERLLALGFEFPFVPGAVVDHPPRRKPGPIVIARRHESEAAYWLASGKDVSLLRSYVRPILGTAYREMRQHCSLSAWWWISTNVPVELAALCWLFPGWKRRLRAHNAVDDFRKDAIRRARSSQRVVPSS